MAPALALLTTLTALAAPLAPPAPLPLDPVRVLARLATGEPSVAAAQEAAARLLDEAIPDPSVLAGRRRLAAWLPRLAAEVRHEEQSYRVVGLQASGEVDYLRSQPGTTLLLRATWELPDLVATTGEPGAAAASLTRARRREEVVHHVTDLYYERQRLRLLLALEPPSDPRLHAEVELELDRVTAELDRSTGGLWSGRGRP